MSIAQQNQINELRGRLEVLEIKMNILNGTPRTVDGMPDPDPKPEDKIKEKDKVIEDIKPVKKDNESPAPIKATPIGLEG